MSRHRILGVALLAVVAAAAPIAIDMPMRLLWNATASAPIGFYAIEPADRLTAPELVAVMPPEPLAAFMVGRGYLGESVPLLKRVAGLPGQRVCRTGRAVTVDGVALGDALDRDRIGRALPVWRGCRAIAPGELFLMNSGVRDSLDGRYFGPLPASAVVGRARPLWTDEDGDGRFVWRAPTR
ncbi:S26 family signal peptidase [Shinella zoogloeoides]|uniref:S26 family signal peptidase n=1 Tax=Shinella zoogloeoides TaxID=352475 RepID=A0A6N8TLK7_SHIZO|nr:S26 family signal peptidase [Shinella zoogloeoides]MXO02030.1 S26 family signal peptidase [Shinella zoogloeoides]UEX81662.1 S26 family signal peptidase [Shinella zoogloeoides]